MTGATAMSSKKQQRASCRDEWFKGDGGAYDQQSMLTDAGCPAKLGEFSLCHQSLASSLLVVDGWGL
jgi:hypothetical protein